MTFVMVELGHYSVSYISSLFHSHYPQHLGNIIVTLIALYVEQFFFKSLSLIQNLVPVPLHRMDEIRRAKT